MMSLVKEELRIGIDRFLRTTAAIAVLASSSPAPRVDIPRGGIAPVFGKAEASAGILGNNVEIEAGGEKISIEFDPNWSLEEKRFLTNSTVEIFQLLGEVFGPRRESGGRNLMLVKRSEKVVDDMMSRWGHVGAYDLFRGWTECGRVVDLCEVVVDGITGKDDLSPPLPHELTHYWLGYQTEAYWQLRGKYQMPSGKTDLRFVLSNENLSVMMEKLWLNRRFGVDMGGDDFSWKIIRTDPNFFKKLRGALSDETVTEEYQTWEEVLELLEEVSPKVAVIYK